MSDSARVISIKILDKEYQVGCPPEERPALMDSAELLNSRMREIRDGGRVVGLERIAVMAALNIANELIRSRDRGEVLETKAKARVKAMRERVETALHTGRQLEL
jgi:cell division protein ZapA